MSGWLPAAVAAGGLLCPLQMWWRQRTGRRSCCTAAPAPPRTQTALLRERQQRLAGRIARLHAEREGTLRG